MSKIADSRIKVGPSPSTEKFVWFALIKFSNEDKGFYVTLKAIVVLKVCLDFLVI